MANNFELLRQALSASESSIRLAKQLLNDVERGKPAGDKLKKKVLPGLMGTFDGEFYTYVSVNCLSDYGCFCGG